MHSRRSFLGRAGIAALGAAAMGSLGVPAVRAACRGIGARPGVGPAFAGGLETRNGANVGYYPFRVWSGDGGTWMYSGDTGSGRAGRRMVWLSNGTEFSVQSVLNYGGCHGDGNCGSDSPRIRPAAAGELHWGYCETRPAPGVGAVAARTADQGWVFARHLQFVGYAAHTLRTGPACRDFEIHRHEGRAVARHGRPSGRCPAPNPSCDAVNRCGEGDTDCRSDWGATTNYGVDSPYYATCLGGYEYSPFVGREYAPQPGVPIGETDMRVADPMPLSYLFFAPRSNTKTYLHAGDVVRVIYRRTMRIGHRTVPSTRSSWYGVEVVESQCPVLCPVGTRGWVMAYSEWDQERSGRGAFFSRAARR